MLFASFALMIPYLVTSACAHGPTASNADSAPTAITQEPPAPPAHPSVAELAGPKGSRAKGILTFTNEGTDIHVIGEFWNLKKNSAHGLHVHENPACEGPKFESAGPHWNPQKVSHGGPDSKMRHPGDLGNVMTDKKGHGTLDIKIPNGTNVGTFEGRSVILHAKKDDETSQPAGDSGDKIACGLVVTKTP